MSHQIAFVREDGIIELVAIAKTITLPEFVRSYDTEMTIGSDRITPIPQAIQAAEMTVDLKDAVTNRTISAYIKTAFKQKKQVTIAIIRTQLDGAKKIAIGRFYRGFINHPGATIASDRAEESQLKLQISDYWETENGVEIFRLSRNDAISVEDVMSIYA